MDTSFTCLAYVGAIPREPLSMPGVVGVKGTDRVWIGGGLGNLGGLVGDGSVGVGPRGWELVGVVVCAGTPGCVVESESRRVPR